MPNTQQQSELSELGGAVYVNTRAHNKCETEEQEDGWVGQMVGGKRATYQLLSERLTRRISPAHRSIFSCTETIHCVQRLTISHLSRLPVPPGNIFLVRLEFINF